MTTPSIVPEIPGLTFTCYDVSQIGSISGLFPARAGRCGIYVLLFDDGSVYGGQAEDVVSRFANHRRTWLPRNIVGLRFSPCSEKDLDRLEQLTVTWLEVQGHNLQNKMLTGKPGGHGVVAVTLVTGEVVHLPWNRADRAPLATLVPPGRRKRNDPKYRQYQMLSKHPKYAGIVELLAHYVRETIPNPVRSQGMWSLTAMPGTNRGTDWERLFTLNIGTMEAMFAVQERSAWNAREPQFLLNVRPVDGMRQLVKGLPAQTRRSMEFGPTNYGRAFEVSAFDVVGTEPLASLMTYGFVLDAAYHLNVSLMREGSRMHARHHNVYFAADVLARAAQVEPSAPVKIPPVTEIRRLTGRRWFRRRSL